MWDKDGDSSRALLGNPDALVSEYPIPTCQLLSLLSQNYVVVIITPLMLTWIARKWPEALL